MKIYYINNILKIILFFKIINIILTQNKFENDLKEFIESPKLIKNQLCSFNGISTANSTYIKCQCYDGFVKDNNIRKINNFEVDCSYQLKSRLITFVLSLIVPFGFDYFYLGYNAVFIIIFIFSICLLILNLYLLNCVIKHDKLISVGNIDKNFEKKFSKYKCAVIIIDFIFLGFYIINLILQGTGAIKDRNGFSTMYDYSLE